MTARATTLGRALVASLVVVLASAPWWPVGLREAAPWLALLCGIVGAALLARSIGRRRWTVPLVLPALPLWLLALGVVWPVADAPLPDRLPARYAFTDVRVVDVAGGTVGPPTAVTVERGTIAAIGPAPSGVPVIDGGGAFVMPGLWDMHVHSFMATPRLSHALMLASGVTSVRDMMSCPTPPDPLVACIADKRAWSAEAEAGARAGPRYVGLASFYFNSPDLTPAEVRTRARRYRTQGADALKVYNDLSRPAYIALTDEARRLGLPVVGHLPRSVSLEEAIGRGQRSFEHARIFTDACGGSPPSGAAGPDRTAAILSADRPAPCDRLMRRMAQAGAAFVPTHVTREEDARAHEGFDPGLEWLDPLSRWAWRDDRAATVAAYPGPEGAALLRRYHERGLALTRAAHTRAVTILVGTDALPAGPRYHDELALLVSAGLTPAETLRAATLSAARFAGRDDRFGTVKPGNAADLLLAGRNPLDDIGTLRSPHGLIFAGRFYGPADLQALKDYTRRQAANPANWAKLLWGFWTSPSSAEL